MVCCRDGGQLKTMAFKKPQVHCMKDIWAGGRLFFLFVKERHFMGECVFSHIPEASQTWRPRCCGLSRDHMLVVHTEGVFRQATGIRRRAIAILSDPPATR